MTQGDGRAVIGTCCDLHGRNCEPPSELCCENCTEADHPGHTRLVPRSSPDLSAVSPDGVCQRCGGTGCVACSARHLRRERRWPTTPVEIDPVAAEAWIAKNAAETAHVDAGPDPLSPQERRAVLRDLLERKKGQLNAVLNLHRVEGGGEYCQEDGFHWPCATYRAATDESA